MIANGSKIKLEKPMGIFDNVGEICEVVKVTEEGVISFKFGEGRHLGCMSYNEFEKYFSLVIPKKKKTKKWTAWISAKDPIYMEATGEKIYYEYRTNGKKVECRLSCENGSVKSSASCNDNYDKFEYWKGLELAKARLNIKVMKMLF